MSFFTRVQAQRKAVMFIAALLSAAGIALMLHLPISLFPDITFPRIVVLADNGEEPAARMMIEVTKPIEEVVSSLPGVKVLRSVTSRGSAEISVYLDWGTNVLQTLQLLQGRIANIRNQLPAGASIQSEQMSVSVFPIEGYSLTSKTRSLVELRDIALYQLRPALLKVQGVARVEVTGGETREFLVTVKPERLAQYHLDIRQVSDAITKTNFVSSTGLIENNDRLYLSLVSGLLKTSDDIGAVTVASQDGVPIHVSDLAAVTTSIADQFIRTSAHGRDAVLINVMKQPTGSTVQIGDDVQQTLKSVKLPPDVTFENFYDQAGYISDSIDGTRDCILIGIGLAMFILLIFLRSWRISLVIALIVPMIVASTFAFLYAINETINIMTLGGIAAAVGLLIDDSIVVVESIFTHFALESRKGEDAHVVFGRAASRSLKEMMPAIVGSTLSTIVIHIPLGFLSGITGAFFRSLSITMVFALVLSFLFSIMLAPLLASGFLRAKDIEHEVKAAEKPSRIGTGYERMMHFTMRFKWFVVPVALGVGFLTYLLFSNLGSGFMPEMDEGSFVIDYSSPPGTSLTETNRMLMNLESVLMKTPEVESYSRRTGTQLGFFLTEPNTGDYTVKLKRQRSKPIDDVISDVRTRVLAIEPRLRIDFGQILQDVIGDLTNSPAPIEIKLFGSDPRILQSKADEVLNLIQPVRGVVDGFNGVVVSGPSYVVTVDAQRASLFELTPSDVREQLEIMMRGKAETNVQYPEKVVAIRVRFPRSYHFDMDSINEIVLATEKGVLVPLSSVANVKIMTGETEIDREGLRPYVAVTARIEGRDLGSTMAEIQSVLYKKLSFPPGMSVEYGGVYQTEQESFRSLLTVALIALLLVFLVLLIEFRDFRTPIAILLITVLSLSGVFGALEITGTTLNISSIVGLIMLLGIVAENAIFILHVTKKRILGGEDIEHAIIRATHERLRPVAMTTLAAVLALLPLAIGIGKGSEMQKPLAIAVIGGFSVSTILLFFMLPQVYAIFYSSRKTPPKTKH
jgi:CzcA family heavy metal efflux pump